MKLSTRLIKFINQHYSAAGDPASNGVDDLVQRIGAQLAAVEEVIDFGSRFKDVVIVKVVSCEGHPNADRLHVCKVDDAGKTKSVERDENGLVQVVCGAPNVHAGMFAAWLPPGATVPNSYDDEEPFVLDARELRGVKSNGMMASPKELSLGEGHEGILEVEADYPGVAPGAFFADVYHLRDDVIIDMENKMFTHRPDCFGFIGLAREIEGIYNRPYKSPDWYCTDPAFPDVETDELPLTVTNELPDLVLRFTAITLRDIQVGQSPVWLQVDLARNGVRSINNIVDYTNFFMLETGQPVHAYDYDKVKAIAGGEASLTIRHPRKGEKITLLNGKEIEPRAEAMMVAAGDHLVCVGGAIGGADTEVDKNTKNIIIEAASWDMYSMRKTSMVHGIFTDAVTRFNKGQSPLQNLAALAKMVDEVRSVAGGKVASKLIDINNVPKEALERGNIHPPVTVTTQFINERLGLDLSAEEMARLLTNVEFLVKVSDDKLTVTAPFWRTDIEIEEDIVEEVGRLYGFDKIPLALPQRDASPALRNPQLELRSRVRNVLSCAGANEVLTYNFVHENLFDKVGQDKDQAFRLSNALSPDLQYFRLSLTPSLLEKVHANIKAGYDQFALFEINKVHSKTAVDNQGLPHEFTRVALTVAANDKLSRAELAGAPYYVARKYLVELLAGTMMSFEFKPLAEADFSGHELTDQMVKPFDKNRSAVLVKDGNIVGVVGEYRPGVMKALKLPTCSAGFEVFASALEVEAGSQYVQLPRFPKVEQDICLKVDADMPYGQVFQFVWNHLSENRPDTTYHTLSAVDVYQREDDAEHKQITLRISLASYERTLTDVEVSTLLEHVATAASGELHAVRV